MTDHWQWWLCVLDRFRACSGGCARTVLRKILLSTTLLALAFVARKTDCPQHSAVQKSAPPASGQEASPLTCNAQTVEVAPKEREVRFGPLMRVGAAYLDVSRPNPQKRISPRDPGIRFWETSRSINPLLDLGGQATGLHSTRYVSIGPSVANTRPCAGRAPRRSEWGRRTIWPADWR